MIHIVMDSAGDLPETWMDKFPIHVIPINIHFGEKQYLHGVDLDYEGFYKLVDNSGVIPKTSQPTPQQFVDFYKKIAHPGDTILSIHVTSMLSGTYESAEQAGTELADKYQIIPFDSGCGSAAMGFMCREACTMAGENKSIDDIVERLLYIRQSVNIILTLDNLDYAKMSGRVKALQAALASLLNVKPIVILGDGVLQMADKVRTRSKSIDHILNLSEARVGNTLVNAAVVHARDISSGKMLLEMTRERFNCNDLILTDLSIAVAANLGPGTVGIITYPI